MAASAPSPQRFAPSATKLSVWLAVIALQIATVSAQECCEQPSWIFDRSTFSHDPATGARVAQYERHAPVEELPDPRLVTSGYRRTRTNIRGADGSVDSYYQVQSYGNGRGGLDAEWERFHDAWRQSYTAGGYYNGPGYGAPGYGYGYGPGYGAGFGYGPGYGYGYPPVHPHPSPYHHPHTHHGGAAKSAEE